MAKIGDVIEIPREVVFEWKVKDFFTLPDEVYTHYVSPKFYYSGASWEIWIFPNGQVQNKSEGWVSLHLMRMSSGSSVTVNYAFGLVNVDGKTESEINFTRKFEGKYFRAGVPRFLKRELLMEKKSSLSSTNDLTVICTLKSSQRNVVDRSLFHRHQDVCDNLREIYVKAKRANFKLKFNEQSLLTHQMILETRSPVFAAMFSHDTKENQTGEMSIEDIDRSTMNNLLLHIYAGDINNPTKENAFALYAAADKYDIKDVKEICCEYINRNFSVEWVCDVIKFADLYQEDDISLRAKEYFKENADQILESESWKTFAKENHRLSIELLGSLVKVLLPRKTNLNGTTS